MCQFMRIILIVCIGVFVSAFKPSYVVKAGMQQSFPMDQSVREADLIIVGRVGGLIDTKPAARARKHLEAHWIYVEQTLMGIEETGQKLAARPTGLLWEEGKSYIIFLKRVGIGNFVEAVPQTLVEATQPNIAAVVEEVVAQGGYVRPMPGFWMQYTGGWGVITEILIATEGNFEWKRQLKSPDSAEQKYEKLSGNLSGEAIKSLIRQVAQVDPGPTADDADILIFRWLDEKGEVQFKSCFLQDNLPCAKLLESIETLVIQHIKH